MEKLTVYTNITTPVTEIIVGRNLMTIQNYEEFIIVTGPDHPSYFMMTSCMMVPQKQGSDSKLPGK